MNSKFLALAVLAAVPGIANANCGQFGGGYVGANLGWGSYKNEFNDRDGLGKSIDDGLPSSITATDTGVGGGVQGGYNFQRGCGLFGVEADWTLSNLKTSKTQLDGDQSPSFPVTDSVTVKSKLKSFGTLRARGGVIVDDVLIYATGGLALGKFKRDFTYFEDGPATTASFSSNKNQLGWTAGAGAEWKLAERWTLKGEFLFMQYKQEDTKATGGAVIGAAGFPYKLDSNDSAWIMRLGVNYRF